MSHTEVSHRVLAAIGLVLVGCSCAAVIAWLRFYETFASALVATPSGPEWSHVQVSASMRSYYNGIVVMLPWFYLGAIALVAIASAKARGKSVGQSFSHCSHRTARQLFPSNRASRPC